MTQQIQPIFIMPENTKRNTGKSAQYNNISAAKQVSETIRTTLGPKGMDKMIVGVDGEMVVTNDGVTILREMNINHPAAKMMVNIAKNQELIVGDGTTSVVIIAGELLKKAESLLELDIHPTIIAKGYHLASIKSKEILNKLSIGIELGGVNILKQIAQTAMTGKGAESNKDYFSDLIIEAIGLVSNRDDIKIKTLIGNNSKESKLIRGVILEKERVHPGMPTEIHNAKIALLNSSLEIKNTEIDAKIQITNPDQLNSFLAQEEKSLMEIANKVISTGCNVLICQKGIDDLAQHFLSKAGILALRRVKKSEIEFLSKSTGADIINDWKDLKEEHLGFAQLVTERKVDNSEYIFVEGCHNPKALTLLIYGTTPHFIEEIKRALEDAIGDLFTALNCGKIVAGAGATEMLLSKQLLHYSNQLHGKEQLAVKAFAEALNSIPKTLAENSGLDPIDVLAKLRSSDLSWPGIDVFSGKVINSFDEGIIEPLTIKTQAIHSASEVAEMILRIDDVIINNSSNENEGQIPN